MNNQQAIHCQKVYTDETVCEECELYSVCTHETQADIARLAISALEKQIPKKVIRQHEEPTEEEAEEAKELIDLGFCGGDVIRCPNCNEYIVVDKLKYCMECGQALDWKS